MTAVFAALASALWLGILTSISPCPLASNIAAVSYVGRQAGRGALRVLLAGLAYSAGRAVGYIAVAVLVVSGVLSIPGVSLFLQERMNQVLGPLLVVIGIGMLGWMPWPRAGRGTEDRPGRLARLRERVAGRGLGGAAVLGFLFALSFCPVSAGLFFGGLIPLATGARSRVMLPAVYGLGTGLPVVVFAVLLALGARGVAGAFRALSGVERVARVASGVIFLAAGAYLILTHLAGVTLSAPGS